MILSGTILTGISACLLVGDGTRLSRATSGEGRAEPDRTTEDIERGAKCPAKEAG